MTLQEMGALDFVPLASGLFAASSGLSASESGYQNVWVRDNVYIAYAHLIRGDLPTAARVARAVLTFFQKYERRLLDIIAGAADPEEVASRPHVRFNGDPIQEIPGQTWAHAQNDALGYFLWLVARLGLDRALELSARDAKTLLLFLRYLQAIRFWQDADSGHWEEIRKVSASSIGSVVAGLEQLSALLRSEQRGDELAAFGTHGAALLGDLIAHGRDALARILPAECVQGSSLQRRRYDAALTFLVYPLRVLDDEMVRTVLTNVNEQLTGEIGIRRYPRDSYWAPDYDVKLEPADRTRDFSQDMDSRNRLLEHPGDEAEWCLFDGMVSAHYGLEFLTTHSPLARERQVHHLNRALRQVSAETAATPDRCPELYYLKGGQLIPNPHTPLLWAQANLVVALEQMRATLHLRGIHNRHETRYPM